MEILVEIVFGLFQFILELSLQLIFEVLAEFGLRSSRDVFRRRIQPHPVLAGCAYALLGAAAGWVSLLIVPHSLIDSAPLRILNLIATPVAAGLVMMLIGAWRRRRDQELLRIDRFWCGFLFAFGMAVARFVWGE